MKKIIILTIMALCLPSLAEAQKDVSKAQDTFSYKLDKTVIVEANKASEGKSAVPFVNIDKAQIEDQITGLDLPLLLGKSVGMHSYSENGNWVGYSNITLRGFDQRRISVLVNGIPQNDPEDHNSYWINISDIAESAENIQIQRGAGLSNYGAAAIAGSINISTSNFLNEKGIKIYSGLGLQEFGAEDEISPSVSKFKFEYSSGLVDNKYGFAAKVSRINSFGYRQGSWAKLNSFYLSAVRLDEKLFTQVNVYGNSQTDGLAYNGLPKEYIKDKSLRRLNYTYFEYDSSGKNFSWGNNRIKSEMESFTSPHFEIHNSYVASENLTLNSALFFFGGEGYFDYSGAGWTYASSFLLDSLNGYPNAEDPRNPLIRGYVNNKQLGWIPTLNYKHTDGVLSAGLEIRMHRSNHWGKLIFAENLPANYDMERKFYEYDGKRDIYSIFAREEYAVSKDLVINLEAQFVNHSYRIGNDRLGNSYRTYQTDNGETKGINGEDIFDVNYYFFNPRLGANYKIDENQNVFALVALTSREPRMSNLYNASESWTGKNPVFEIDSSGGTIKYNFDKPLVKPESMLDIELGYNYLSQNFRFSGTAYLMDYSNELVKSGRLDIFGAPIDANAPKTRHIGIELDASYRLIITANSNLLFYANAALSSNKIVDFDFITNNGKSVSLKDNDISGFASSLANFGIGYTLSEFRIDLSAQYNSGFRTDNFDDMLTTNTDIFSHFDDYSRYSDNKVDAFTVFNMNLSYKFTNIIDKESIRLHLQINNLANSLYAGSGSGKEFFPAAERNIFLGIELGL